MSTFNETLRRLVWWLVFPLLAAVTVVRAQTTLYITDGDSRSLQAINTTTGGIIYSVTTANLNGAPSYPIAVRNTIWLGSRDFSGQAIEYNLATGAPTGSQVNTTGVSWSQTVDGAVNGDFNYTFRAFTSSTTVYQTNSDWTNASPLFNLSGNGSFVGITYDSASGNLWLNDSSSLYEYSLTGVLLTQFAITNGYGALAYQFSTDTLWFVPNNSSLPLVQYAKNGTVLQSLTVTGRSGNVFGAEFVALPEPSTYALLALGAGWLIAASRRRRS